MFNYTSGFKKYFLFFNMVIICISHLNVNLFRFQTISSLFCFEKTISLVKKIVYLFMIIWITLIDKGEVIEIKIAACLIKSIIIIVILSYQFIVKIIECQPNLNDTVLDFIFITWNNTAFLRARVTILL